MSNYQRTETVDAMQWCRQGCVEMCVHSWPDHDSVDDIVVWVNANGGEARYEPAVPDGAGIRPHSIAVRTSTGWAYAAPGDWIVPGDERVALPMRVESDPSSCLAFIVVSAADWAAAGRQLT